MRAPSSVGGAARSRRDLARNERPEVKALRLLQPPTESSWLLASETGLPSPVTVATQGISSVPEVWMSGGFSEISVQRVSIQLKRFVHN